MKAFMRQMKQFMHFAYRRQLYIVLLGRLFRVQRTAIWLPLVIMLAGTVSLLDAQSYNIELWWNPSGGTQVYFNGFLTSGHQGDWIRVSVDSWDPNGVQYS